MMMYNNTTTRILLLISLLVIANVVAATATATTTTTASTSTTTTTTTPAVVSTFQSDDSDSSKSQHQDQENQEQENRNLLQGSIQEKWAISDPPTWNYNELDFFLEFQVSNYIIPGQAHVEIYSYDTCKDDGPSGLPGSGTIQTNGFIPFQQEDVDYSDWNNDETSVLYTDSNFKVNEKTIILPISIDSTTIGTNSDVYTTYEDSDQNTQGTMKFCVRYSLRTLNPDDPVEMNFREVLVTLDIKLSPNSFTLDGAAVVVQKAEANRFNLPDFYDGVIFELIGYICNPVTGDDITTGDNNIAIQQGELIDICVKPATNDRNDGILMYNIKEFTWIRNDVSSDGTTTTSTPTRTQIAIENGRSSSNGLSNYIPENCPYSNYCTFNTFLSSSFYLDGPGIVGGSGTASMTYEGTGSNSNANNGTGRRRRSRRTIMDVAFNMDIDHSKRSLQDNNNNNENENDNALFNLKINIAAATATDDDDDNGQKAAAAAASIMSVSTTTTTAIIIIAATAAAAFIIAM